MIKNTENIVVEVPALTEEQLEEVKALPNVYQTDYEGVILKIYFAGGTKNLVHVLDYLQEKELVFGNIHSQLPTLNDVFLEITGKELRD